MPAKFCPYVLYHRILYNLASFSPESGVDHGTSIPRGARSPQEGIEKSEEGPSRPGPGISWEQSPLGNPVPSASGSASGSGSGSDGAQSDSAPPDCQPYSRGPRPGIYPLMLLRSVELKTAIAPGTHFLSPLTLTLSLREREELVFSPRGKGREAGLSQGERE